MRGAIAIAVLAACSSTRAPKYGGSAPCPACQTDDAIDAIARCAADAGCARDLVKAL